MNNAFQQGGTQGSIHGQVRSMETPNFCGDTDITGRDEETGKTAPGGCAAKDIGQDDG